MQRATEKESCGLWLFVFEGNDGSSSTNLEITNSGKCAALPNAEPCQMWNPAKCGKVRGVWHSNSERRSFHGADPSSPLAHLLVK